MRQMSTALSDLVLSLTSFGTAFFLVRLDIFASAGFLLMGIAAGCGALRFSQAAPSDQVLYLHKNLAWITTLLGTSLVASGFHRQHHNPIMSSLQMGSALAIVILSKVTDVFSRATEELLVDGVSSFAVVSMGIFSILHANPFGILVAVMYVIAGAVGTKGYLGGVRRVDWFHYVLAFANVVFLRAFMYASPNVFYKEG